MLLYITQGSELTIFNGERLLVPCPDAEPHQHEEGNDRDT